MEITRVIIKNQKTFGKVLAHCAVVVDNCLKLDGIEYCESEELGKFLTFPSKQGVYKEVLAVNKGNRISLPRNKKVINNPNRKKFEEFYYPVTADLYKAILNAVSCAYNDFVSVNGLEGSAVIS